MMFKTVTSKLVKTVYISSLEKLVYRQPKREFTRLADFGQIWFLIPKMCVIRLNSVIFLLFFLLEASGQSVLLD